MRDTFTPVLLAPVRSNTEPFAETFASPKADGNKWEADSTPLEDA